MKGEDGVPPLGTRDLEERNEKEEQLTIGIAYHEAGHAVAFEILGFGCISISIAEEEADVLGRTSGLDYWHNEEEAANWIVATLAGYAAQVQFDESRVMLALIGASDDIPEAARVAGIFDPGDRDTLDTIWLPKAKEFVADKKVWEAIVLLAREVMASPTGKLDSYEVECLIREAGGDQEARDDLNRYRSLGRA